MTDHLYLVPVFDARSLKCATIGVSAPHECEAVYRVLRNAAQLRYTGGAIERVEVNEATAVAFDPWADRHRPARLKETAE
jgi:hypothetical protein